MKYVGNKKLIVAKSVPYDLLRWDVNFANVVFQY